MTFRLYKKILLQQFSELLLEISKDVMVMESRLHTITV